LRSKRDDDENKNALITFYDSLTHTQTRAVRLHRPCLSHVRTRGWYATRP
jgi:hypothetical protein